MRLSGRPLRLNPKSTRHPLRPRLLSPLSPLVSVPPLSSLSPSLCQSLLSRKSFSTQFPEDFQKKNAPLRNDIKTLGSYLGEMISLRSGEETLHTVEELRGLAKRWRNEHHAASFDQLTKTIEDMSTENIAVIARAFAHFLSLANTAENFHRERRRRELFDNQQKEVQETNPITFRASTLPELFRFLLKNRCDKDALLKEFLKLRVEMVLTAHPTEVNKRTLLHKYADISSTLRKKETEKLTEVEKWNLDNMLKGVIKTIWETDEIRRRKPTPLDEALSGIYQVESVLWEAIPSYLREVDYVMMNDIQCTTEPLPYDIPFFTFCSWMGGDRDGNPNVTSKVTEEVCNVSRFVALRLYLKEVRELHNELSMSSSSSTLLSFLPTGKSVRGEPYREVLETIERKLVASMEVMRSKIGSLGGRLVEGALGVHLEGKHDLPPVSSAGISTFDQLYKPLDACYKSLCETGLSLVANGRLLDLLRRLKAFGLPLLRLDLRQEASKHTAVLDAVTTFLGLPSYGKMNEEARMSFLLDELSKKRPLIPQFWSRREGVHQQKGTFGDREERLIVMDESLWDVVDTFRIAAEQPEGVLGAYICSMCSTPSDVLAICLLQREAGISPPLRVVPLFETLSDLQNCEDTMRKLFQVQWYREFAQGKQEVMIGYSDSAKDAGKIASAWSLFKAQEELIAISNEMEIELTLFHGKGGSVSRGGGEGGRGTYRGLLSQPQGSLKHGLRVTEQGEIIANQFGTVPLASRALEIYAMSLIATSFYPPPNPPDEWRDVMEQLSQVSCQEYRQLIRQDKRFIPYFRSATPEVELATKLKIGSRPARRMKGKAASGGVESLRAIPWVFAWTQTRLHLTAWLGVASALQAAISAGQLKTLQTMYHQWSFFRTLIDMISMVLVKSETKIAERYDKLLLSPDDQAGQQLGAQLRKDLSTTSSLMLKITEETSLMSHNFVLLHSLSVRNPYVDVLNLIQAEVLKRIRGMKELEAAEEERVLSCPATAVPDLPREQREFRMLHDAFVTSVTGIAAGMRNTG